MKLSFLRFPFRAPVFLAYFFSLWGGALVLTLLVLLWLDYQQHSHNVEKQLAQESTRLSAGVTNVNYDLSQAIAHLNILDGSPALRVYANAPSPTHRQAVAQTFRIFLANDDIYNQIWLLDLSGRELVRVDMSNGGPPRVVGPGDLADHAGASYVREGVLLAPDTVLLSSLDGSHAPAGQGGAQQPRLHFVAPVFDSDKRRVGVLVLTMHGERLVRGLENALNGRVGRPMLLDREGKWSVGQSDGVTIPIRPQAYFAERYPLTWQEMSGRESGVVRNAEGIFVFNTIRPMNLASDQSSRRLQSTVVRSRDSNWNLVSIIPPELARFDPWRALASEPVLLALIFFGAGGVSLVIARARAVAIAHVAKTRESEAQLRTVLDNTLALAFLKDREGRYLFANRQFRNVIGADPGALIGMRDDELFPTAQAAVYRANDLKVLQNRAPAEFEEVLTTKEGDRVFISVKFPLQQPDGSLAVCGISTDITERKHAEDAMRLAAVVFENTNEGIIVTDANRRIVTVNSAYTRITGYQEDEVLGRSPHIHASGTHDEEFYRDLWQSLEETDQWQGEIWDRHRSGRVIPLWENISVVRDQNGQITNYVAVMSDISAIKEAEERLSFLAHHDSLTGLPNRLLFHSSLEQAMVEARRSHRRVAVMLLDLDRFKLVNDTLGHAAGDQLLKFVSARLRDAVREEDTVSRLGGDEFTIILRDIDSAEDLAHVAEKIIGAVERPLTLNGQEVSVGVSIGISLFPDDALTVDSLATAADTAMYRAKERGKRTFEFYAAEMTAAASRRLILESELRDALHSGELELYYQPQVDMYTGLPIGMEALLRWNHPTRGLLLPGQFIGVAEESGLIHNIGQWVIETGCRQAAQWYRDGCLPGPVSINVSAHQLTRDHLGQFIEAALLAERLAPAAVALELEITESVLNVSPQSERLLHELQALGIKIVIDDFGTGFSSLSQLRRLPVDKIKIAGEFVQDIPEDDNDMAIAAAIISLGRSLGLPVIAEGVETPAQVSFLRERGCQIAQGFYYSRPLTAEAAERLFRKTAAAT